LPDGFDAQGADLVADRTDPVTEVPVQLDCPLEEDQLVGDVRAKASYKAVRQDGQRMNSWSKPATYS
jgi:hypothetical protein